MFPVLRVQFMSVQFTPIMAMLFLMGNFASAAMASTGAQTEAEQNSGVALSKKQISLQEPANLTDSIVKAEVGFSAQSISQKASSQQFDDSQSVNIRFLRSAPATTDSNFSTKLAIEAHTLNTEGDLLLAAPEFYLNWGSTGDSGETRKSATTSSAELSIGRKINQFSSVDQFFGFGLIEPNFGWQGIERTEQGLAGLHTHLKSAQAEWGGLELTASLTGIFLPNQNAGVKQVGSNLVASNRWAPAPPRQLRINGELKDINYKIDDIDYARIINQQGYFAKLGWTTGLVALSLGAGDLPMNDLAISREIYTDLDLNPKVILVPQVLRHQITQAEVKFKSEDGAGEWVATLGVLGSDPRETQIPEGLEGQSPQSATITSAVLTWKNKSSMFSVRELGLGYIQVSGGDIQDFKSDGSTAQFQLQKSRFQFEQALQAQVGIELLENAQSLVTNNTRFLYDLNQRGSYLDSKINWQVRKLGLHLQAGLTVLGVESSNPDADEVDLGLLEKMSANDRVYGGVSYVF